MRVLGVYYKKNFRFYWYSKYFWDFDQDRIFDIKDFKYVINKKVFS